MFAGFSSFPAQLDRSLAAAAGLAVELVLVAEDMAAFEAVAGTAASIVAAATVALVLALAAGRPAAAGMIEAAAANWQIVVLCFAGRLAAGLGSAALSVAGLLVGLVSAADMNS
jgi:hypothetical protein